MNINNQEINIFVATHKKFKIETNNPIYYPIFGGASLYPEVELGYLKDNIGENISIKKEMYNELTSFYWAWKNSNAQIKGLCHYRRYFYKTNASVNPKYIINSKDILNALNDVDIILPSPYIHRGVSNFNSYNKNGAGVIEDLEITRMVLKEKYPEYLDSYDYFMNLEWASLCNSFIAKREIFDSYAEWLFDILFEVEKRINVSERKGQQRRAFGFLGERLLNVWVMKNNFKIKYYMMNRCDIEKNCSYFLHVLADKVGAYKILNKGIYFHEKWKGKI